MTEEPMRISSGVGNTIKSTSGQSQTTCDPTLLPVYHVMLLDRLEKLQSRAEKAEGELARLKAVQTPVCPTCRSEFVSTCSDPFHDVPD